MKVGDIVFVVKNSEIIEARLKEIATKESAYFERTVGASGKMFAAKKTNVYKTREEAKKAVGENEKPRTQVVRETKACCGQRMTHYAALGYWKCDECDSITYGTPDNFDMASFVGRE